MADTKISDLVELTALAPDDELVVVDKSDATMAASGTNKKIRADLAGVPRIIHKTADETVNNSITLQDDNHLVLPVVANATYHFEMTLFVSSAGTRDIQLGWTVPAGTTMRWGPAGTASSDSPWSAADFGNVGIAAVLTESETATPGTLSTAPGVVIPVKGQIIVSSTAGNVQLQWAQRSIGASDSKVLTNSVLIAHRIA